MATAAEQVLKDALGLGPVERAALIEYLFRSFDNLNDQHRETAWGTEIESRLDAFDQGKISASSAEEVMARINRQ